MFIIRRDGRMHKRKAIILWVMIFGMLIFVSCTKKSNIKKQAVLYINGRALNVEIASKDEERQKGLMYRKELGENEGMLFVFEKDKILSFWMKNTSIPLSIAFLDKNGKVIDIYDMKPFSLEPVVSKLKCRYALEVNRGYFNKCGLKVGDKIDLTGIYKK